MRAYPHGCRLPILSLLIVFGGCSFLLPSHPRVEDYTPVFAAASAGDIFTVRIAVEQNASLIKAREWDGLTLLHDAVAHNRENVAIYLLGKGADVNARTEEGLTPLHIAAQNGNIPMIRLLLTRGANVDARDGKGRTPLERAEKWGHPDAAEFLRQYRGRGGVSG